MVQHIEQQRQCNQMQVFFCASEKNRSLTCTNSFKLNSNMKQGKTTKNSVGNELIFGYNLTQLLLFVVA